jgi:hypothetical protein
MRVERGSDGNRVSGLSAKRTSGGGLGEPGGSPSSKQNRHVQCLAPELYSRQVAKLHYGPARVPSRESPEEAIALLQERGYTACEIDFEGKFWMKNP